MEIPCALCDKVFTKIYLFHAHMRTKHPNNMCSRAVPTLGVLSQVVKVKESVIKRLDPSAEYDAVIENIRDGQMFKNMLSNKHKKLLV